MRFAIAPIHSHVIIQCFIRNHNISPIPSIYLLNVILLNQWMRFVQGHSACRSTHVRLSLQSFLMILTQYNTYSYHVETRNWLGLLRTALDNQSLLYNILLKSINPYSIYYVMTAILCSQKNFCQTLGATLFVFCKTSGMISLRHLI